MTDDLIALITRLELFEVLLHIIPYLVSTLLNLALWYYIRLYAARSRFISSDELLLNSTTTTNTAAATTTNTVVVIEDTRNRPIKPLDSYHIVLIANNLTDLPLYLLWLNHVYYWYSGDRSNALMLAKPTSNTAYFIYMLGHSFDFFIYIKFHKQFNSTVKSFFQVKLSVV